MATSSTGAGHNSGTALGTASQGHELDARVPSPFMAIPSSVPHPICPGTPTLPNCKVSLGRHEAGRTLGITVHPQHTDEETNGAEEGGAVRARWSPGKLLLSHSCHHPAADRAGGSFLPKAAHSGLVHTSSLTPPLVPQRWGSTRMGEPGTRRRQRRAVLRDSFSSLRLRFTLPRLHPPNTSCPRTRTCCHISSASYGD